MRMCSYVLLIYNKILIKMNENNIGKCIDYYGNWRILNLFLLNFYEY
jgi:hypothetical protein